MAQGLEPLVRQERHGDVAVLVMANPPVNALSNALRAGLSEALAAAIADPEVRAIVLRGEGRGFCAGADISEFGKPRTALRLGDLCLAIEASPKPVIAAIHGMALGGGLELALAAHYRVAGQGAMLGLPEVNLGILPGAGGTQRLPRILGAREALRMMLTGAPITAMAAAASGLVDRLVETGVVEAAIDLARQVPGPRPTGERRDGMMDGRAYLAAVSEARAAESLNRLPAAARIVDLVEAALVFPLAQGLVAEETAFAELVKTPEAAGLRHAFFVEKRAQQLPPALAGLTLPNPASLGLWGSGEEMADLGYQALAAGMRVVLATPERNDLLRVVGQLAERQEAEVQAGRMTPETRDADWARLETATDLAALVGLDLVLCGLDAPVLPQDLAQRQDCAVLGGAGVGHPLALTPAPAKSGLAELGIGPGAKLETMQMLAGFARRLNWRLVPVGPGGPVELGLRQALASALEYLTRIGVSLDEATQALGQWMRPRLAKDQPATLGPLQAEIVSVCLAAMAAEGARMIEDGRVARPATLDAVAILSGLVPRWEGGPMFQADQRGLLVLRRDLQVLAPAAGVFATSGLFDRLIADGKGFASLN